MGGAKNVIIHSHSTHGNHVYIHYALRPLVKRMSNVRLACGEMAGRWMYGKGKDFTVIPNGVDTEDYRFAPQNRESVRKDLGLADDTFVIGHVGTLSVVKNQVFLLKLIKQIADEGDSRTILMLIGDGPIRAELTATVERMGLAGHVMFLGVRNDVGRLMAAMDVFCLPSLFEGFPIVAVEAQTSGLPVIISSEVSSEVCITDLVRQLPINEGTGQWKNEISKLYSSRGNRQNYADVVREAGFDIHDSAQMLETIYKRNDKGINAEHCADDLRRHRNDNSQLCDESG